MKINPQVRMATDKQISYIEGLLIDIGIGIDRIRRNAHISSWINRDIKFLSELTLTEASQVIEKLKEIKENEL